MMLQSRGLERIYDIIRNLGNFTKITPALHWDYTRFAQRLNIQGDVTIVCAIGRSATVVKTLIELLKFHLDL